MQISTKHLLATILLLAFCTSVQAQKIKGGIQAGMSVAQVDGDDYSGYRKPGVFAGTFAYFPFESIKCKLQLEINYVQKGSRATANGVYKIALHQIEVPLLFGWNLWKGLTLQAGLSFNILASAKELLNNEDLETDNKFHLFECGCVADVNYCIREHYGIGAKFNYSVSPIGRNHVLRDDGRYPHTYMWNNAFIFYIYYQF